MTIECLYPTGRGFSQVAIATGNRHNFISGQCSLDEKGDIAAQTEQILKNIEHGLRESGANWDDLVRMTVYVVDYTSAKRDVMQEVRNRFIPPDSGPASTLIGVSRLVSDEFFSEIEAQAPARPNNLVATK